MKNVKLKVNLRSLLQSLAVATLLVIFTFAGSGFITFSEGDLKKKKTADTDSLKSEKGVFKSLFPANYFDPSKPIVTRLNPAAVPFVQRYMEQEGENLEKMKVWGKPYFDLYDNILPQFGLPKELKYLSVIESALIPGITSPMGAVGPWQIMPSEARENGLRVNSEIDERKNFTKSTYCAARILKGLYKELNDWLLVVAAYNCGIGRVKQAIRRSGSHNFWELQMYLPAETRSHVKRFIGTHYILEGNGGLTTMTASEILELKSDDGSESAGVEKNMMLEISGKYKAAVIARNIGMALADFDRLNPDFDRLIGTGKQYQLKLPEQKIIAFANNKNAILNESLQHLLNN